MNETWKKTWVHPLFIKFVVLEVQDHPLTFKTAGTGFMDDDFELLHNVLGERIDGLEQEAVDPLENLEDLELDFLDEDILECDNMRGLIQVNLYGEQNSVLLYVSKISSLRCVCLDLFLATILTVHIYS